eukprot:35820-Hanusia_phi.AAC.1
MEEGEGGGSLPPYLACSRRACSQGITLSVAPWTIKLGHLTCVACQPSGTRKGRSTYEMHSSEGYKFANSAVNQEVTMPACCQTDQ